MATENTVHFTIDYVEQYVPMAKPLVYWHMHALGFGVEAYKGVDNGYPGYASYLLRSNDVRLVLTSAYPSFKHDQKGDILDFVHSRYAGVKRIVLKTPIVEEAFEKALSAGAIPVKFPASYEDEHGVIQDAAIRLYDYAEIVFLNRERYSGVFLPGYKRMQQGQSGDQLFDKVDHIASELRMNEMPYWTNYLQRAIGTRLAQQIPRSDDNKTGMLLNINQTPDENITLVMAEPDSANNMSKVQQNIDNYGPGIHHIAFTTRDIVSAVKALKKCSVETVSFPRSYYALLRNNPEFNGFDIDELESHGILVDKEENSILLQKFIKPYGDRPFFLYEIVQRINGYSGFALNNINVLKKAEEMELMREPAAVGE